MLKEKAKKTCPGVTGETWSGADVGPGVCKGLTKPCRAD